MSTPSQRLAHALSERRSRPEPVRAGSLTEAPGPYEHTTRQLLERVDADLHELRAEVRRFWWTLIGAVALSLILQLLP